MQTNERRVLRPRTVAERLDISTSTLWQWVKNDKTFPKFFKLGPSASVMWADELDAWMQRRAKARQPDKPAPGPGRPRKEAKSQPEAASAKRHSREGMARQPSVARRPSNLQKRTTKTIGRRLK